LISVAGCRRLDETSSASKNGPEVSKSPVEWSRSTEFGRSRPIFGVLDDRSVERDCSGRERDHRSVERDCSGREGDDRSVERHSRRVERDGLGVSIDSPCVSFEGRKEGELVEPSSQLPAYSVSVFGVRRPTAKNSVAGFRARASSGSLSATRLSDV